VYHGANPDYAFNIVPFEKGFQLMYYIGSQVLDYYEMQDFIQWYINKNSLYSINAFTGFRRSMAMFIENYFTNTDQVNALLEKIAYAEWIYGVGTGPTNTITFPSVRATNATDLANAYIALDGLSSPANFADYFNFTVDQRVVF